MCKNSSIFIWLSSIYSIVPAERSNPASYRLRSSREPTPTRDTLDFSWFLYRSMTDGDADGGERPDDHRPDHLADRRRSDGEAGE
jgi:hypothetical protein